MQQRTEIQENWINDTTTDASRGRLAGAARKRRPSNRCPSQGMLIPAAGRPAAALSDGGGGAGARKLILERNKPYLGLGVRWMTR